MKYNFMQIAKTLEKLFIAGFNTQKKILSMKMEDLAKIDNINSQEMLIIIDLKKAIGNKKIIQFLSGYNEKEGENIENI